jgi:hypothetical protein
MIEVDLFPECKMAYSKENFKSGIHYTKGLGRKTTIASQLT